MGAPWFNRQDDTDVIESGIYKVESGKQVRFGYPLKLGGTTGTAGVPAYTNFQLVEEYDDATSAETCIGVSDDQIPKGTGTYAEALKNIEFRHYRREVAVVQFGTRMMVNKEGSTVLKGGEPVAPYPGGFVKWATGKQYLGVVKRGPVKPGSQGMILINTINKVV
jgi:hypothetical protein